HVKRVCADPGLVCQIGRRLARFYPRFDDLAQRLALAAQEPSLEPGIELIDGQVQRMQDEISCLIERVGSAMAIDQLLRVEAAHGIAQQIANGQQLIAWGLLSGHLAVTRLSWQRGKAHALSWGGRGYHVCRIATGDMRARPRRARPGSFANKDGKAKTLSSI